MTTVTDIEDLIKIAESLIEDAKEDLAALKKEQERQEVEPLFGRWVTHPKYGRGIVSSVKTNNRGDIVVSFPDSADRTGASRHWVNTRDLTLDPITLDTERAFEDAPTGTIVEAIEEPLDVYVKVDGAWLITGEGYTLLSGEMSRCRVVRWGEHYNPLDS